MLAKIAYCHQEFNKLVQLTQKYVRAKVQMTHVRTNICDCLHDTDDDTVEYIFLTSHTTTVAYKMCFNAATVNKIKKIK